jgi:hypothetical protein
MDDNRGRGARNITIEMLAGLPQTVRCALVATAALVALAFSLADAVAAPVAGGGGSSAGVGWWRPPQRLTWYWQLQGKVKNGVSVGAYDIDGFENSAREVAALHALRRRVICYIDVGTAESFRPDYHLFPASVLGRTNGWPGERWLDIRRLGVLEQIMTARFRMCREKRFDAVEPDNIEAFSNGSGFSITAQQQLTFNEWVAGEVHSLGMAVLQKNDGEQSIQQQPYFDGALSEQCNELLECASFQPYLRARKPVLNAEYGLARSRFCAADNRASIMGARFNLDLNGNTFKPCW